MKKWIAVIGLVASLNFAGAHLAGAQEAENDKFSFGRVVSVGADQLTIKEYDFAKDADVETSYSVTAQTEYGNLTALKDLAVNDDIVVDYVEKDGKRVITTLVKEEKTAEAVMPEADEAVKPADNAVSSASATAADAASVNAATPASADAK